MHGSKDKEVISPTRYLSGSVIILADFDYFDYI